MKISCYMQPGHEESTSQDRLLVIDTILASGQFSQYAARMEEGCYAVFDGVGGLDGGAYASSYAAIQLLSFPIRANERALLAYIHGIAEHLRSHGGCATTASGIAFSHSRALLFHIGNTRVWVYKDGYFERLTDDQTYNMELVSPISEEVYERNKSVITGCLGGDRAYLADRLIVSDITSELSLTSHLLFTSDGIHDYVDAYNLEQLITGETTLCDIVGKARNGGSEDDCSIMLIHLSDTDRQN